VIELTILGILAAVVLVALLSPKPIKPDEQAKLDWEARTRKRLQDDHK
jgi:hypothetical protein